MRIKGVFKAAASIALVGVCLAPFSRAAGQSSAEDIVSRLQEKYKNVSTVVADFSQVSTDALNIKKISEGKVYFKKPGKMKWLYYIPVRDELVSDGKTT